VLLRRLAGVRAALSARRIVAGAMSTDGAHHADGGLPAPERDIGGAAAQLEGGAGVAASADADARSSFFGARDSAAAGAFTVGALLPPEGGAYAGDATPPLLASWPADAAPDAQAATVVASLDDAAAEAAEAGAQRVALSEHAAGSPEAFIGRYVRRRIASKRRGARWFDGEVLSTRFSRDDGRLWGVRYDDGTEEELNADELRACLLPEGAQRAAAPPAATADATPPQFKGVHVSGGGKYDMELNYLGKRLTETGFATPEAAAHAYDAAARERGIKVLNFPNADAGEVQAVRGESNDATLKRLGLLGGAAAAATPRRPPQQQPPPRGAAAPGAAAHGGALSMYDRLKQPRGAQRNAAPDDAEQSEDPPDESDVDEADGASEEDGEDDASEQEEHEATPRKVQRRVPKTRPCLVRDAYAGW
jgi:hypothetical protein